MRLYGGVPVSRENEKPNRESCCYHYRLCRGPNHSSFLTCLARLECLSSKTQGRSPGCFVHTRGIVSPLSASREEEEISHLKGLLPLLSKNPPTLLPLKRGGSVLGLACMPPSGWSQDQFHQHIWVFYCTNPLGICNLPLLWPLKVLN